MSELANRKMIQKSSEKIKCDICSKELVKGSMKRHKETQHEKKEEAQKKRAEETKKKPTKVNSDATNVKVIEEDNDIEFHDCVELEEGDIIGLGVAEYERLAPFVSSAELDSYLPQNDSLLDEFLALEQVVHDEVVHDVAAQEKDFGDMFTSSFAEDMRRHSLDMKQLKKCDDCDKTNAKFEKQRKAMLKQDDSVRAADMALKNAEYTKKFLRKRLEKKENDLNDITISWQTDAETYSAEITRLSVELQLQKDMVKVLKAERENTTNPTTTKHLVIEKEPVVHDIVSEKSIDKDVIIVVDDKCPNCEYLAIHKGDLKKHIQKKHRIFDCMLCPLKFKSLKEYNVHRETHLEEMSLCYTCNKCNKRFKYKVEMIAHMVHPCTVQETLKEPNKISNGNSNHIVDTCSKCDKCKCTKCKVTTSSNESISPHINSIHRQEKDAPLCRHGPSCRFLKQNRCNFFHPEAAQPEGGRWQKVGPRRPRQQQKQGHGPLPDVLEGNVLWCSWEDKCCKGRFCKFKHPAVQRRLGNMIAHDMDFPPQVAQRSP